MQEAFAKAPVSHRSDQFMRDIGETKRMLCELVNARHVEIMTGSGTLANDAIGAQISLDKAKTLVLVNGEFGTRLADQARRFQLDHVKLQIEWGEVFTPEIIERALDENPGVRYIWGVHCETSTGILNNLDMLKAVCAKRGVRLCLDCISSIGMTPVNLDGVYFASGVSGKAIGSFPGLSLVFYNHELSPRATGLPRYMDLGYYASKDGVPFTLSSNLLYALRAAMFEIDRKKDFAGRAALAERLCARLRELGFAVVAPPEHAAPAVLTLALPDDTRSEMVGDWLEEAGFLLSYKSEYLIRRNWIQICLMGECSWEMTVPLLDVIKEACAAARGQTQAAVGE